ncbi:MAG: polysaccharide deacetylase family protein [Saprospiraceae bacterium]|nr:polysaccharide deacetylase family protein [Saprospiraceae bacterium]
MQFVLDFIQKQFTNLQIRIKDSAFSSNIEGIIIQYGGIPSGSHYYISYQGLNEIENMDPIADYEKMEFPILFKSEDDLGFDIFSAIFWMLSFQFERKLNSRHKDQHGRISCIHHPFYKKRQYKLPIIEYWIDLFIKQLQERNQLVFHRKIHGEISLGIDIDQAWKYKYKSGIRSLGGLMGSIIKLKYNELIERIEVLCNIRKDPFDTYQYLNQFDLSRNQLIYFVLNGNNPKLDPNHSFSHPKFRQLIQWLSTNHPIGLHPSYHTIEEPDRLKDQKEMLEEIITIPLTKSRQHYLRILIPDTLSALEELGIRDDYSISFFDDTGFRAGTCHAFYYYDLSNERSTNLIIHPVIAMDRTYLQYLKYSSAQVLHDIGKLLSEVRLMNGEAHIIWHNSSFDFKAEWKTFDGLFEKLIQWIKN